MQIKLDTIIRHLTFIHIHQNILNQVRSLGGCFIGKQVDWYLGILYRQMQIKNSTRVTQWLLCVQLKKMEFHAVCFPFEFSWSRRVKPSWSYLYQNLKLKLSPHHLQYEKKADTSDGNSNDTSNQRKNSDYHCYRRKTEEQIIKV